MKPRTLTPAQEQLLRDQVITADRPGPVLHDFHVLLGALGPDGVEAGGKHHLLPMKLIGELDRQLSRPLNLGLKRPQLRSHPYLQGLNLLLRASGLTRVEGTGTKARLAVDPVMRAQWDRLNPTEQYFNLLEAWLRIGRPEMVGERGRIWEGLLFPILLEWQHIPARGQTFEGKRPGEIYLHGIGREFYLLALMDLFGLVAVDPPPPPVSTWYPGGIRRVPFGDAVLTLLPGPFDLLDEALEDEESEDEESEDEESEDEESPPERQFGVWQPLFLPYFPEWRHNLEIPRVEPREGVYVFRVSLGKVWRLIAMPSDATLDDLASWILDSVDFDDDHLYEFTYRDRLGATRTASHPMMDEGPWASEVALGELPLEPGQSMRFLFDFGDNWQFTVKLERIEPPGKGKLPRILETHGKAPEQYPSWDE